MNLGLHIGFPAFQTFKPFSVRSTQICFQSGVLRFVFSQEYSDWSVLVVWLIYPFIVSAGTSSGVFYVYYYCLLESET